MTTTNISWKLSSKFDVQSGDARLWELSISSESIHGMLAQWLESLGDNVFREIKVPTVPTHQLLPRQFQLRRWHHVIISFSCFCTAETKIYYLQCFDDVLYNKASCLVKNDQANGWLNHNWSSCPFTALQLSSKYFLQLFPHVDCGTSSPPASNSENTCQLNKMYISLWYDAAFSATETVSHHKKWLHISSRKT